VKKALAENIRKEKHKKDEYHQHRFQTDDDDDDDDDDDYDEALSLRNPKNVLERWACQKEARPKCSRRSTGLRPRSVNRWRAKLTNHALSG